MFRKEIDKGKMEGSYLVYEPKDTIPSDIEVNTDRRNIREGQWITDINGLTAQVLKVVIFTNNVIISTVYGADCPYIHSVNRKGGKERELNFLRKRPNRFALSTGSKKRLTPKDKLFLRAITMGEEVIQAFERIYGLVVDSHFDKYNMNKKIRLILSVPESQGIIMSAMKDIIKSKGLDSAKWFIDKMHESVSGPISNQTQLEIFNTLGTVAARTTGDEDLKTLFLDGDSRKQLPEGEEPFQLITPEETEFEEVNENA